MHIWHQIVYSADGNKKRVAKDVPRTKTATAEGNRYLYVTQEAKNILEELRNINGDKHYILNGRFTSNPITLNKFNEHLKKYCEKAGVRYLSSHKIRFFGATELFNAGVSPEQIRRVMGHTSISMTEHYNRTDGGINIDINTWNSVFDKPRNKKKPDGD